MTSPFSIKILLSRAASMIDSDSPRLDAEILLAHALGKPRSHLFAWPERVPQPSQIAAFNKLVQRRVKGEPVAYLVGEQEFWSLPLTVTPDVLIPRPETEQLVELALEKHSASTGDVLELGVGSGAIAIALASERPRWTLLATDRSAAALQVAKRNARRLGFDNIHFLEGDWYNPLPAGRRFDLIVSNPPYIPANDPHLQRGDLRFEPGSALVSAASGLADISKIAAGALDRLHPAGWLLLEHGYDQACDVRAIFRHAGLTEVHSTTDLAGHERVTLGRSHCQP